jgi:hypothetical protein
MGLTPIKQFTKHLSGSDVVITDLSPQIGSDLASQIERQSRGQRGKTSLVSFDGGRVPCHGGLGRSLLAADLCRPKHDQSRCPRPSCRCAAQRSALICAASRYRRLERFRFTNLRLRPRFVCALGSAVFTTVPCFRTHPMIGSRRPVTSPCIRTAINPKVASQAALREAERQCHASPREQGHGINARGLQTNC